MDIYAQRVYDNIAAELTGVVPRLLQQAMFGTVQDFCKESNAWRVTLNVPVTPPGKTYTLAVPASTMAVNLIALRHANDSTVRATMPEPNDLLLTYEPSQAETLLAEVSLMPIDPADGENLPVGPDWIYSRYGSIIEDGVRARLHAMPNKSFSNQPLALFYARKFRGATRLAGIDIQNQNLKGGQRWMFPQNFATGR